MLWALLPLLKNVKGCICKVTWMRGEVDSNIQNSVDGDDEDGIVGLAAS